jgi:alkaline phosphatase D
MISRRDFLALALWAPVVARAATPKFSEYPFSLGVASGYPLPDGIALWTRLAPRPLEGGGMDPEPAEVRWEVAEDDAFKRIVRSGVAIAPPEGAHSVHVEVDGLAPSRVYHYRFHCADATSAGGRTRTAPEAGRGDERLRLAVANCQQYEQGWFVAHRHLANEDVDLVAFVGDYIYESSWGREHVRKHGAAEPATLAEYRDRYALYKSDPDLQKSHAAAPWVVIWDDHEVDNDYAGDRSEELDPAFAKRRTAAYKAFVEHMPVRRSVLVAGGGVRIHQRLDWGTLAKLHLLDGRQFRSPQACPKPYRGGGNVVGADCTQRLDPALTMLGLEQERWLDVGLAESRASWNLIVQPTLFVPAARIAKSGALVHWTDGWDGYPAARERLVDSIVKHKPANPVFLGGDVHGAYHANVHARPADPESPVVATEFVATSITSQMTNYAQTEGQMRANPHIKYANGQARGYALLEIARPGLEARVRAVETVKKPEAAMSTIANANIVAGKAGLA